MVRLLLQLASHGIACLFTLIQRANPVG